MEIKQKCGWDEEKYFAGLKKDVDKEYEVASAARAKGLDPVDKVETPLAMTMAEKSVGLIATVYPHLPVQDISRRMLELEKEYGQLDTTVSFVIAREIAEGAFCKFKDQLEAIDAGIRVGFAYNTLGVVSCPIEGYTGLRLGKTKDGEDYFIASFSGPIRAAGTTSICVCLMLIDYLREHFGYAKYDSTEDEVRRYVTENTDYHERVTNLQYFPTEEEMIFLAERLPIQIDGDPTEKFEVSNYKDLPRVASNRIRGGMCLTFSEGLAQKAEKALGRLTSCKDNGLICTGWDWLIDYVKLHKKRESGKEDVVATYIKDIVAGRPVFGHPGRSGGFRFRYGRSRAAGFSGVAVHPATMGITNSFLSHGTQLKTEKPTKGCIITSCDKIDGPIVKLKDGSVKRISDFNESRKIYGDVEEIIYLGDILFPLGDIIDRNSELPKPGYVEEWWGLEVGEKVSESLGSQNFSGEKSSPNSRLDLADKDNVSKSSRLTHPDSRSFASNNRDSETSDYVKDAFNVMLSRAVELSKKHNVPLHPKYIFYWSQISVDDFKALMEWVGNSVWRGKLVLPWGSSVREKFSGGKRALELLGVEHEVVLDNVVVDGDVDALLVNLGIGGLEEGRSLKVFTDKIVEKISGVKCAHPICSSAIGASCADSELRDDALRSRSRLSKSSPTPNGRASPSLVGNGEGGPKEDPKDVLDIINECCEFEIKDKAGDFIGARMGRPEKAKLRKLPGGPNGLFPVSNQGGRLRSVQDAVKVGFVNSGWPIFKCECGSETIYPLCEKCGKKTQRHYYCRECRSISDEKCSEHAGGGYRYGKIDVKHYFEKSVGLLGYEDYEVPPLVKGVRRMSNDSKEFENLAKGVLRAKFNLSVNKDGTIRYDGTEIPLTHFKPLEIRTSVEKLRALGYVEDIYGNVLEREDQILELRPHDVVLPSCPETQDEKADDVFLNIANFIDEELERMYKLPRHFNLKSREDLVGQLVVCMAPHNCAGVVGRIIGFGKMQGLVASPYMHAAMRRDCDGDEAAVMLLMDVLINFSRKFLPSHRGGAQDAPLVLNARIRAGEVDDQILTFEMCDHYPLEVYRLAEQREHSSKCNVEKVSDRLAAGVSPLTCAGFTHDTSDINLGVLNGAYKVLPTMKEKVEKQMELVKKIRAVDTDDVARLILERHFIRDIRGNLRKFGRQGFRCSSCNEKFRRPPLKGSCTKCDGKIIFTISEGSIKKYLGPALKLSADYNISEYTRESLNLTKDYIDSIFGDSGVKDVGTSLGEFG